MPRSPEQRLQQLASEPLRFNEHGRLDQNPALEIYTYMEKQLKGRSVHGAKNLLESFRITAEQSKEQVEYLHFWGSNIKALLQPFRRFVQQGLEPMIQAFNHPDDWVRTGYEGDQILASRYIPIDDFIPNTVSTKDCRELFSRLHETDTALIAGITGVFFGTPMGPPHRPSFPIYHTESSRPLYRAIGTPKIEEGVHNPGVFTVLGLQVSSGEAKTQYHFVRPNDVGFNLVNRTFGHGFFAVGEVLPVVGTSRMSYKLPGETSAQEAYLCDARLMKQPFEPGSPHYDENPNPLIPQLRLGGAIFVSN